MQKLLTKITNSPEFKLGQKEQKEGKIPKDKGIPIKWVKVKVTPKEWNNIYSKDSSYCFLRKEGNMVVVSFLCAKHTNPQLEELTQEELWQTHCGMKARRSYPLPLEENSKQPKSELTKLNEEIEKGNTLL